MPSGDTGRIKPEITAIGVNLDTATVVREGQNNYKEQTGTSYANAFVAGASALIKEKQSRYTPLEIKTALLLGADWKASIPATATDYDNKRTGIYDVMNKYGFGVLNIEKSLDYSNSNEYPNIIRDTSNRGFAEQNYRIYAQQDERVKVLLSWFVHPRGSILTPELPFDSPFVGIPAQFHNYDLKVTYPDGTIRSSTSDVQNNEFVVFDAPSTGLYTITVSSDGTTQTVVGEPFVIASTHGLDKFPYDFVPPTPPVTDPPTTDPPTETPTGNIVSSYSDDFDDLDGWILSGNGNWEAASPDEDVPGENRLTNTVASSSDCGDQCILTLNNPLRTAKPLSISFDRFIKDNADGDEGLYVQYLKDGKWVTLASYTEDNGQDTEIWTSTSLTLSSGRDVTNLRLVADSNAPREIVEIDNLVIRTIGGGGGGPSIPSDTTDPSITAPPDVRSEATGILTQVDIGSAVATDNRDSSPAITNDAPDSFPLGTTIITWTATDNAENTDTDTQTITIQDTTKPVFTSSPDDISFTSAEPRQVGFDTPEATDIFPVTVSCSHIDGSVFGFGITDVTCTATDTSDNHTTISFTVTINRIPLTITAPPDVITEATAVMTMVDAGTATTNIVSQITSDVPESFPLGDTTITWTATSPSGQTATATQIITVQDTTKPVFEGTYDNIALESDGPVSFDVPIATDIFTVIVSCSPSPGDLFPAGTTTVTCTATDASNNSDTTSFDVIVTRPISASHPIRAPADIIHEATDVLTVLDIGTPTTYPGVTTANDAPESFPLGDTTVTWTATNGTGYRFTDTQTVTVQDTTNPVFDVSYNNITFETQAPYRFPFTPPASDIFPVMVSCNLPPDYIFPFGTTTVTCTATDSSDNSASLSFRVTIIKMPADDIHPEITAPANIMVEATGILSIIDIGTATATDDMYPKPTVTNDAPDSFPLGTTTVTWTATDGAGNRASAIQTVTVQDTTRPVFTENPGIIEIRSPVPIPLSYDIPQATDIFPVIVSCSPPPGEGLVEVGAVRIIGCRATDTSGNIASLQIGVGITPPRDSPMKRYGIQNFEIETGETATLHLNTKFTHDGPLLYTVTLDNLQIASVEITGQMAVMTGLAQGITGATACADNGRHTPLCQVFEIRVAVPAP